MIDYKVNLITGYRIPSVFNCSGISAYKGENISDWAEIIVPSQHRVNNAVQQKFSDFIDTGEYY